MSYNFRVDALHYFSTVKLARSFSHQHDGSEGGEGFTLRRQHRARPEETGQSG